VAPEILVMSEFGSPRSALTAENRSEARKSYLLRGPLKANAKRYAALAEKLEAARRQRG
jgi:hypothetical protein